MEEGARKRKVTGTARGGRRERARRAVGTVGGAIR